MGDSSWGDGLGEGLTSAGDGGGDGLQRAMRASFLLWNSWLVRRGYAHLSRQTSAKYCALRITSATQWQPVTLSCNLCVQKVDRILTFQGAGWARGWEMGLVKGWEMDWGTVTEMVTVKEKDCRAVPASATTANEIRHSSHYPGHNCVCLLEPARPSHEAFVGRLLWALLLREERAWDSARGGAMGRVRVRGTAAGSRAGW